MSGVRVNKNFLLKTNKIHIHVDQNEILYFQSDGKYVNIFHEDKKYIIRSSLRNLMPLLDSNFVRIHASFVLNVNKVEHVENATKKVVVRGGHEIFFSRSYKDSLFENFIVG